jgi:serine/alanine adding enzyme
MVNIIRIHHPSGKLFDAYRSFSNTHEKAVFFQSEAFIHLIEKWPEADWVLLLAVREEGFQDPGAHHTPYRPGDIFKDTSRGVIPPSESKSKGSAVEASRITASLLAVVIREQPPDSPLLKPFGGLYNKLTARTIVYGGPLLAETTRLQQELTTGALLKALHQQVRRRSLFTQFRNSYDLSGFIPLFREQGYEYQERLNLLVNTTSHNETWQNISSSRRRQLRQSIKNGASIIKNPGKEQLDAFYAILKDLYDNKVKKPLPGRVFFSALSEISDNKKITHEEALNARADNSVTYGKILLVACDGKIIGGIACVLMPGKCIHEWYVCGLDREYKDRQVYPSVMATWAAIEYATENNIPIFDFMGLGKPGKPYGVRDFKEKFGGTWVNHGRFFRVNQALWYSLAEVGYNTLYFLKRKKQKNGKA